MKIGLAGLGKMGTAMAMRLISVGHAVMVWNRSADKAEPLIAAGATLAESPAALVAANDIIITMLANETALDAVYNGPSGLLSGNPAGKLFIEMSTERPPVQVALAAKVRASGAAFVECPVGGSIGPARDGKLIGLMGAEPADAERARPVLEQLCRRLEFCGPVGAGSTMKLAINLPLMVAWQSYGEAFAICRDVGFDPKRLLGLFVDTNGVNNAFKLRAAMMTTLFEGGDPGPTTFSIANGAKDIRAMLDVGKAKGIDLPTLGRTLAAFEEAEAHGLGEADGAAVAIYWAQRKPS